MKLALEMSSSFGVMALFTWLRFLLSLPAVLSFCALALAAGAAMGWLLAGMRRPGPELLVMMQVSDAENGAFLAATYYVDGQCVAIGLPRHEMSLPGVGHHQIEVVADGYRRYTLVLDFEIESPRTLFVPIALTRSTRRDP